MTFIDVARRIEDAYSASYPPSVLHSPTDPHIDSLSPNTGSAAAGPITVTVTGRNFTPASVIEIAQQAATTTFVSATSLTTSYDPATAGTRNFTVRDGSQESNSVPFTVGAAAQQEQTGTVPTEPEPEPEQPEPEPEPPKVSGGNGGTGGGGTGPRKRAPRNGNT